MTSNPTVFTCPSCGAPVSLTDIDAPAIECPYCRSSVVVPEELRTEPPVETEPIPEIPDFDPNAPLRPVIVSTLGGQVDINRLREMRRLARSGHKIEAIKIYRELFDVDLKEAKDVIDRLAAGEPVALHMGPFAGAPMAGPMGPPPMRGRRGMMRRPVVIGGPEGTPSPIPRIMRFFIFIIIAIILVSFMFPLCISLFGVILAAILGAPQ